MTELTSEAVPMEHSIFAGDELAKIDEMLTLYSLVLRIFEAAANNDYETEKRLKDEYLVHYPVELFDQLMEEVRLAGHDKPLWHPSRREQ